MRRSERVRRRAKKMAREKVLPIQKESEPHKVYLWRLHSLKKAGLDADAAKRIADTDFDLHKALDMLEAGCTPELLLEIVF